MKPSKYNIFIPTSNKSELILYNTLNSSVFIIDESSRIAIENTNTNSIDSTFYDDLIRKGIFVDDELDENLVFQISRNRIKFGGSSLNLVILSTFTCNLNCTYCFVPFLWDSWGKRVPYKSMNKTTADATLKFIKIATIENDYNTIVIDFIGLGEPLITFDLIHYFINEIEHFIVENNIILNINIVTNGTLISREILKKLHNYNVYFQITLNGPKNVHNKRRMYKDETGTYDDIIEALKLLKEFEFPFAIRVNIDKRNYTHVESLLDNLTQQISRGLHLKFFPVLSSTERNCAWSSSCLSNEELNIISKLWQLATQKGFIVLLRPLVNYIPCKALFYDSYIIDISGDVYKCEGFAGNQSFKISSVMELSNRLKLRNPYYEWMNLDPLQSNDCKNCALLPACGGGCPQLQFFYDGKYQSDLCTQNKEFIIKNIQFQLKRFYPDIP